jgi:small-conductance mechanosensitive channel
MNDNIRVIYLPTVIAVIIIFILVLIRSIFFRVIRKWADKTETEVDDIIISAVKIPSFYWMIAIGLYIGITVSDLPPRYIIYLSKTIYLIVILSVSYAASNLSGMIFSHYVHKSNLPIPTSGLAYGILKGTILILGVLIALTVLGVSITPLLTALGVGGLAVALAIQDTLANLFAGIHILVEKSIRVGDFIRLESGQEGFVEDITWRTTRIRMLPNNMVIIPNNKLSQSVVTNYYLPQKSMAISIPFSVSYDSDPEKIEKVVSEIAKTAAVEVHGLLEEPPPLVRLVPGFGESTLNFTLNCHIEEITHQYPVEHELRKRIFKRFREEGIVIPFPQRVIHLKKGEG